MARRWGGAIETLADACGARRLLWVLCKGCGHAARHDPRHLQAMRGDLTLLKLQEKLRCRRCGGARAAIVVDDVGWPDRNS